MKINRHILGKYPEGTKLVYVVFSGGYVEAIFTTPEKAKNFVRNSFTEVEHLSIHEYPVDRYTEI